MKVFLTSRRFCVLFCWSWFWLQCKDDWLQCRDVWLQCRDVWLFWKVEDMKDMKDIFQTVEEMKKKCRNFLFLLKCASNELNYRSIAIIVPEIYAVKVSRCLSEKSRKSQNLMVFKGLTMSFWLLDRPRRKSLKYGTLPY